MIPVTARTQVPETLSNLFPNYIFYCLNYNIRTLYKCAFHFICPKVYYKRSRSLWYSMRWSKACSIILCKHCCKHPIKHGKQNTIQINTKSTTPTTLSIWTTHGPSPPNRFFSQLPNGSLSTVIFWVCSLIHVSFWCIDSLWSDKLKQHIPSTSWHPWPWASKRKSIAALFCNTACLMLSISMSSSLNTSVVALACLTDQHANRSTDNMLNERKIQGKHSIMTKILLNPLKGMNTCLAHGPSYCNLEKNSWGSHTVCISNWLERIFNFCILWHIDFEWPLKL